MAAWVAGSSTPGQLCKSALLTVLLLLPTASFLFGHSFSCSPEGSVPPDRRVVRWHPKIEKLHAKLPALRAVTLEPFPRWTDTVVPAPAGDGLHTEGSQHPTQMHMLLLFV